MALPMALDPGSRSMPPPHPRAFWRPPRGATAARTLACYAWTGKLLSLPGSFAVLGAWRVVSRQGAGRRSGPRIRGSPRPFLFIDFDGAWEARKDPWKRDKHDRSSGCCRPGREMLGRMWPCIRLLATAVFRPQRRYFEFVVRGLAATPRTAGEQYLGAANIFDQCC
jgi:hypothetical protein